MNCSCNANDSFFITLVSLSESKYFMGHIKKTYFSLQIRIGFLVQNHI